MSRRRKREDSENEGLAVSFVLLIGLGIWWLVTKFKANREDFLYHIALPTFLMFVVVAGLCIYWRKHKKKHIADLLKQIEEKGHEDGIKIFIAQEGKAKTKTDTSTWNYDVYRFDENQLKRCKDELIKQGVRVSLADLKSILEHYIDAMAAKQLKGIFDQKIAHHSFSELMNGTGVDFENLIARLYEKMGYATKRNGGSGDQGADVIARKDGEHILIQAKCYDERGVSNHAVQEAFAGLAIHGCNKAVVITTSFFQPGAKESAKSNSVELIDKYRLQEMLAEYLHESWS